MNRSQIKIRLMNDTDFNAVIDIDKKIVGTSRVEYYEMKFDKLFQSKEFLPTSLVAEREGGIVVGFIIGELYIGEYGISRDGATLDTIGVDPDFRHMGIGKLLINDFYDHLRELGVKKLITFVDKNDSNLINFFRTNQFHPSKNIISLEMSL
ncbi:MAG: GNAT family N-acetyltransferase [Thermodesulfobacteriota bacterium]